MFKMITPAAAKRDLNPVKVGLDQKKNLQISLSQDAAHKLGLIPEQDGETPLVALGVSGYKLGIFTASEGQPGFELKQTSNRDASLRRYNVSVPCDALFADVQVESFRARIMTSTQYIEQNGSTGVSVDLQDHLYPSAPVAQTVDAALLDESLEADQPDSHSAIAVERAAMQEDALAHETLDEVDETQGAGNYF